MLHRLSLAFLLIGVAAGLYIGSLHAQSDPATGKAIGWLTVAQFAFTSVCMLLAWFSAPRAMSLRDVRWLLFVAVLARLICLPMEPYTSNDIDRYMFDGKIAISGYDPYQVTHDAPELAELRSVWQPPVEHVQYPTLYPPLSLALFSLSASAGVDAAPVVWKVLATLAGIATVFLSALVLARIGRLQHLSLVALSPLLILETGVGAHVDVFSALFVALSLYYLLGGRQGLAGLCIGLGALVKILPIALLLPLVLGQKQLRPALVLAVAAGATVAVGYGLALFLGLVPIGSIGTLFEKWRFGSPVFSVLSWAVSPAQAAVAVAVGLLLGSALIAQRAWRLPAPIDICSPLLAYTLVMVLLLSPVVFPWYLMALVPLMAVAPRPLLLIWTCTAGLTYEVLGGFYGAGGWEPADWPLVVIFAGLLLGFVFELRHRIPQTSGVGQTPGVVHHV